MYHTKSILFYHKTAKYEIGPYMGLGLRTPQIGSAYFWPFQQLPCLIISSHFWGQCMLTCSPFCEILPNGFLCFELSDDIRAIYCDLLFDLFIDVGTNFITQDMKLVYNYEAIASPSARRKNRSFATVCSLILF